MVYCYPSYGGIYIAKGLSAVDLEYLGIPRLNATSPRSYDPAEEDAFCNKFLRFQPRWYVNYNNYEYENLNSDNELFVETPDAEDVVWDTCSPTTGGLWVWRSTKQEREKVKDDGKETPHKIGTTYNALNMDEKCSILKAAGARFYENAEDWVEWKPANEKIERRKKLLHLYRLWWEHGCDFELDMDDLDMASNWLKDYYDLYEELSVKPDRVMAMEEAENTEKSEL